MTILYRCSGGHHLSTPARESFKFLENVVERAEVARYLSFPNPIFKVFNRGPISAQYSSRFGPPGCPRNPLYTANDVDTTFYEYGFHLLQSHSINDEEIKITCFMIDCDMSGNIADPTSDPNASQILSTSTDYAASHVWFKNLNPSPDIVTYPSLRNPSGTYPASGINNAIHTRVKVKQILEQSHFLMSLDRKKRSFSVYDMLSNWIVTLTPKS